MDGKSWVIAAVFMVVMTSLANGYDVMMVIGGMSTANQYSSYHKSVEVVDVSGVCLATALPHPLVGAGAAKLSDRVVVCGGFDGTYERSDCWQFNPQRGGGRWSLLAPLPHRRGLLFPAAVSDGGHNLFLVGGRSYNHTTKVWDYLTDAWKLNVLTLRWTRLPSLKFPIAEGCLLHVQSDLIFIGGAKAKFQYADDPSKVWVLRSRSTLRQRRQQRPRQRSSSRSEDNNRWEWRDDLIPHIIGPRTWHGCVLTNVDEEAGILISGGYHTGRLAMFYSFDEAYLKSGILSGNGSWETAGWLPAQRQWGPSLGLVAGVPTIAGGMDYGDETLDEFRGWSDWRRNDGKTMRYKREFSAAVTVPNYWFPHCTA